MKLFSYTRSADRAKERSINMVRSDKHLISDKTEFRSRNVHVRSDFNSCIDDGVTDIGTQSSFDFDLS